jgi:hypothetical protein
MSMPGHHDPAYLQIKFDAIVDQTCLLLVQQDLRLRLSYLHYNQRASSDRERLVLG